MNNDAVLELPVLSAPLDLDPSGSKDDDNVLLRPVRGAEGVRGPLVGHLVTAKEVWRLLPDACDAAADSLLTVLTVQRWLTAPSDQRIGPDARRTEARRLALNLAQRRSAASGL